MTAVYDRLRPPGKLDVLLLVCRAHRAHRRHDRRRQLAADYNLPCERGLRILSNSTTASSSFPRTPMLSCAPSPPRPASSPCAAQNPQPSPTSLAPPISAAACAACSRHPGNLMRAGSPSPPTPQPPQPRPLHRVHPHRLRVRVRAAALPRLVRGLWSGRSSPPTASAPTVLPARHDERAASARLLHQPPQQEDRSPSSSAPSPRAPLPTATAMPYSTSSSSAAAMKTCILIPSTPAASTVRSASA